MEKLERLSERLSKLIERLEALKQEVNDNEKLRKEFKDKRAK